MALVPTTPLSISHRFVGDSNGVRFLQELSLDRIRGEVEIGKKYLSGSKHFAFVWLWLFYLDDHFRISENLFCGIIPPQRIRDLAVVAPLSKCQLMSNPAIFGSVDQYIQIIFLKNCKTQNKIMNYSNGWKILRLFL